PSGARRRSAPPRSLRRPSPAWSPRCSRAPRGCRSSPGLCNLGLANLGLANLGLANLGLANLGLANLGLANLGLANLGLANLGPSRQGQRGSTSLRRTLPLRNRRG